MAELSEEEKQRMLAEMRALMDEEEDADEDEDDEDDDESADGEGAGGINETMRPTLQDVQMNNAQDPAQSVQVDESEVMRLEGQVYRVRSWSCRCCS